jgi:uncharacterized protein YndB with AHSA1/START domain
MHKNSFMEKTIYKEVYCEGSPEVVWKALTDANEISIWLMPTADFAPEVGRKFMMQAKPMGSWDGKIYGEILKAEKFKALSYTWKGDQMNNTTVIEWRLTPEHNGTLLSMRHSGFSGFSAYILGVFHSMGWGKFLRKLKKIVEEHERRI